MNADDLLTAFLPALESYQTAIDTHPGGPPLLAHYTTIETMAAIMQHDEVWLSNPLFMNDHEELRLGIEFGMTISRESPDLRDACQDEECYAALRHSLEWVYKQALENNVLDYYVFCLSEHARDDDDGLLSMWRAYGGNGNGAALVFNSTPLSGSKPPYVLLGEVRYIKREQRVASITKVVADFAKLFKPLSVPSLGMIDAASILFDLLKLNSLFTKHDGFREEKEWRLVYLHERDVRQHLKSMLSYSVGHRGVEPKLKFKVGELAKATDQRLSLFTLIDRILLGPSVAGELSKRSIAKMLERQGKSQLAGRLRASTIPLRPLS